MELKELGEMPLFSSDVPPIDAYIMAQIDDRETKLLVEGTHALRQEISVARKENRWLAVHLITAYNLVLQHERLVNEAQRKFFGIPVKLVSLAVSAGAGAVGVKIIDLIIK